MSIPEQLHATFTALSGQKITLSAMRMEVLAEMASRGFTPADVELVWRWVKLQISRNEGGFSTASLQFGTLIGRTIADVDRFEDKLELAKQSKLGKQLRRPGGILGDAKTVTPVPLPQRPAAEQDDLRKQGAEALRKFREERL